MARPLRRIQLLIATHDVAGTVKPIYSRKDDQNDRYQP